jgi:hypothetical protein
MRYQVRSHRRQARVAAGLAALLGLGAGAMALAGVAGADVSTVDGSAFGASVSISLTEDPDIVAEPLPMVTLPSAGGDVEDAAPSVAVGDAGDVLMTGAVTAASQGTLGLPGSAASSASATAVDALAGTLTAVDVASTCTSTEDGITASASVTDGSVVISALETVALPVDPAPGTVVEGTTASGDRFTVTLNDQNVVGTAVTVTAVRIVLDGPVAVGEIVLARSRCAIEATAPTAAPVSEGNPEATVAPADEVAEAATTELGPSSLPVDVATDASVAVAAATAPAADTTTAAAPQNTGTAAAPDTGTAGAAQDPDTTGEDDMGSGGRGSIDLGGRGSTAADPTATESAESESTGAGGRAAGASESAAGAGAGAGVAATASTATPTALPATGAEVRAMLFVALSLLAAGFALVRGPGRPVPAAATPSRRWRTPST